MKNCTNCTKELPDAALHCVFCGTRQPAQPVAAPQNNKTVMGYSAADMLAQLQNRGGAPAGAPVPPAPAPAPPAPVQPVAAPAPAPAGADLGFAQTMASPILPAAGGPAAPAAGGGYGAPAAGGGYGAPGAGGGYGAPGAGGGYGAPAAGGGYGAPAAGGGYGAPAAGGGYGAPGGGGYGAPGGAAPGAASGMATMIAPSSPQAAAPAFAPAFAPAPAPASQAATMFVDQPVLPSASAPMGALQPQPVPAPPPAYAPAPIAQPIASAPPPYLASQTARRAGRPVEPWKDGLRVLMFAFGVLLLGAFATPLSTSPLAFHWDQILHGAGTAKLMPLLIAAVGLLGVVFAAAPLDPAARGFTALVLGLAGIVTPLVVARLTQWQFLVPTVGLMLLLVPGLVIRGEYRDALLPRVMVTLGVVAMFAPLLVPVDGRVPLVGMFKAVVDAPGASKVEAGLALAIPVLVALSLLAWLPAPSTGAAVPLAWLLLLLPMVRHLARLLIAGHLGDAVSASPYGALLAWAPGLAFSGLLAYGLATVAGKQLE